MENIKYIISLNKKYRINKFEIDENNLRWYGESGCEDGISHGSKGCRHGMGGLGKDGYGNGCDLLPAFYAKTYGHGHGSCKYGEGHIFKCGGG